MMRHLSKKHPAHNTLWLCWVGLFLTMALSTPSLLWADTPANAPTTVRPVSVRPIAVRPIPTPAPNIKRVVPTQGRRVRLQPIRNKKTLSRVLRERRQVPPVRRKTVVSNKVVKRLTREQLLRFRRLTDLIISPCCYTQPVSVHPSGASDQVKEQLRTFILQGFSDKKIIAMYVGKYGERILSIPQDQKLFWFPVIVSIIVFLVAFGMIRVWHGRYEKDLAKTKSAEKVDKKKKTASAEQETKKSSSKKKKKKKKSSSTKKKEPSKKDGDKTSGDSWYDVVEES